MRIEHIYRYPVKGFSAEALEEVRLSENQMLPHDRRFALAQGDAPFDPESPAWLPKRNFACLMVNAKIARLHTSYDPRANRLVLRAPDGSVLDESPVTPSGRAAIGEFLSRFLGEEARGTPRFVDAGESDSAAHRFSDNPEKLVSMINLASIQALAERMAMPLDPIRFRANVYFNGAPAFAEFDWLGRHVELGGATLLIVGRIDRCAATTVNPATAERDAQVPKALMQAFGHIDMGVFGQVVAGGRVAVGDAITLREGEELPDAG